MYGMYDFERPGRCASSNRRDGVRIQIGSPSARSCSTLLLGVDVRRSRGRCGPDVIVKLTPSAKRFRPRIEGSYDEADGAVPPTGRQ